TFSTCASAAYSNLAHAPGVSVALGLRNRSTSPKYHPRLSTRLWASHASEHISLRMFQTSFDRNVSSVLPALLNWRVRFEHELAFFQQFAVRTRHVPIHDHCDVRWHLAALERQRNFSFDLFPNELLGINIPLFGLFYQRFHHELQVAATLCVVRGFFQQKSSQLARCDAIALRTTAEIVRIQWRVPRSSRTFQVSE